MRAGHLNVKRSLNAFAFPLSLQAGVARKVNSSEASTVASRVFRVQSPSELTSETVNSSLAGSGVVPGRNTSGSEWNTELRSSDGTYISPVSGLNEGDHQFVPPVLEGQTRLPSGVGSVPDFIENHKAGRLRVVAAESPWGKVAAAATTAQLIASYDVTDIVFSGVAGAVRHGVSIGDVVVGDLREVGVELTDRAEVRRREGADDCVGHALHECDGLRGAHRDGDGHVLGSEVACDGYGGRGGGAGGQPVVDDDDVAPGKPEAPAAPAVEVDPPLEFALLLGDESGDLLIRQPKRAAGLMVDHPHPVLADGTVRVWGANDSSTMANGQNAQGDSFPNPTPVPGITGAASVTA